MNKKKIKDLIIDLKSKDQKANLNQIKEFIDYKEKVLLSDKEIKYFIDELVNEGKLEKNLT
tara:strand:+ start:426 stop:608 length:183 start_codon:yes stop_codon:yes gene_type:complete